MPYVDISPLLMLLATPYVFIIDSCFAAMPAVTLADVLMLRLLIICCYATLLFFFAAAYASRRFRHAFLMLPLIFSLLCFRLILLLIAHDAFLRHYDIFRYTMLMLICICLPPIYHQ